jgi:hypothetical protein
VYEEPIRKGCRSGKGVIRSGLRGAYFVKNPDPRCNQRERGKSIPPQPEIKIHDEKTREYT